MKFLLFTVLLTLSTYTFADYTQTIYETGFTVEQAVERLEWSLETELKEVCVLDSVMMLPNRHYKVSYSCVLEDNCEILDVADIQAMGRAEYVLVCRD